MNTQYHPSPPTPLSNQNTYTSWPGGVDPSVSQFRTEVHATQLGGSKSRRCWARKSNRKLSRKATRKSRKSSRK